jgi:hypothetical protein
MLALGVSSNNDLLKYERQNIFQQAEANFRKANIQQTKSRPHEVMLK